MRIKLLTLLKRKLCSRSFGLDVAGEKVQMIPFQEKTSHNQCLKKIKINKKNKPFFAGAW